MKQCIALAAVACLLATGCASSGLSLGGGTPGHVQTSRSASRPTITRNYRKPGPELGVQMAAFNDECCDATCGCDETGCGCAVDGSCCDGSCGCGGGPCQRLIDNIAGGGCGAGSNGCGPGCGGGGLCPNGQGYPEYPAFNQGPPVGQVAYPYYTTRGPRDFLQDNPPSIGPY
jgi:hypothetical protein